MTYTSREIKQLFFLNKYRKKVIRAHENFLFNLGDDVIMRQVCATGQQFDCAQSLLG